MVSIKKGDGEDQNVLVVGLIARVVRQNTSRFKVSLAVQEVWTYSIVQLCFRVRIAGFEQRVFFAQVVAFGVLYVYLAAAFGLGPRAFFQPPDQLFAHKVKPTMVSQHFKGRLKCGRRALHKMLIKCYNRIMIDVTQDIHSLTTFKRNSSGLMKHMKKTGRPLVLTVKGKAEAVVLDAAAYQGIASQLDAVASIRRGLAQARKGAGRPADEVFDELEREDAAWGSLRGALKEVFAEKGGGEAYLRSERSNFHPKKERE